MHSLTASAPGRESSSLDRLNRLIERIQLLTLGTLAMMIVSLVVGKLFGPWVMKGVNCRKRLEEFVVGLGMSVLGFAAARLHLHVFDPWYLRWGKLDRVLK